MPIEEDNHYNDTFYFLVCKSHLPPKKSSCGLYKVWIDLVCISDFQNVRKYPLEAHLFIHAQ